ncbi:unnamed protein product [Acanthosepion pharaonis]|uniref:Uncharacterized protein n=1 Tax=Acanthosepion pharaonis TaxID=158019 RepID=A0A812E7A4_ACAPH|nr:unnamed protein product [Sepia pharaonis]
MYNYLLFYFPFLPLFLSPFSSVRCTLSSALSFPSPSFYVILPHPFLLQSVFSYSTLLPRYRNTTPLTSLFQLYSFLCLFSLLLPLYFLQLSPSPPISIFLFPFTLYFSPPILIFYLPLHPLLPLRSSSSLPQFTFLLSYSSTTHFPLLPLRSSSSLPHFTFLLPYSSTTYFPLFTLYSSSYYTIFLLLLFLFFFSLHSSFSSAAICISPAKHCHCNYRFLSNNL